MTTPSNDDLINKLGLWSGYLSQVNNSEFDLEEGTSVNSLIEGWIEVEEEIYGELESIELEDNKSNDLVRLYDESCRRMEEINEKADKDLFETFMARYVMRNGHQPYILENNESDNRTTRETYWKETKIRNALEFSRDHDPFKDY